MATKLTVVYLILLVLIIIMSGVVFSLTTSQPRHESSDININSLTTVSLSYQNVWICATSLCLLLLRLALVSIGSGLDISIFKFIIGVCLVGFNLWLLINGSLMLSNLNKRNDALLGNNIQRTIITTAILSIITCCLFLFGLIMGIINNKSRFDIF